MDFNLPEELQMLKDTVRKFVDKELIPIEMHTIENMELKPDIRERLEKKTKEMGLWMFDVPEEYGGGGLGSLAQVLVWEELSRTVRAAVARPGNLRTGGPADSLCAERGAEETFPGSDAARREKALLHADRAGRRLRSGVDEDPRGAPGRSLHRQRHQTFHHRRRRRRLRPADGGHRSGQGRPRRHLLFHGRYEDAGADAGDAITKP